MPEITRRFGITRRTMVRNRSAMHLELDGEQLDLFPEPLLALLS